MVETSIDRSKTSFIHSAIQKEKTAIPRKEYVPRGQVSLEKHSHEVIKAKKIQKKSTPSWWKERAVFLPATESFFRACGINPEFVNPTPIGEGLTNVVFAYEVPDSPKKVIKVARESRKGFMSEGLTHDMENIAVVKKYFGEYAVPTEIRTDSQMGKYLVLQDAVEGKPITNMLESQSIRAQLVDMARLNREMMRQTGFSLDFIGVPGMLTWLRHQFVGIMTNKSNFVLSNIIVDENGKLKIIDEGLLRFGNGLSLKQRVGSSSGFLANRLIMRLYFGVDLQPS